ncbi:hypothetical protein [Klebsiella pneumoniae]|uniref:hypothetical protein n=1 Tax=Klebsiella pneumoniae TaxID=573 RepID=UPI001E643882|nr:hypothetical protein [Klebsiella pneumoniae]
MVMVLTGQLSGAVDSEISRAINELDIIGPYEKPIKSFVIKSNVDKFFSKQIAMNRCLLEYTGSLLLNGRYIVSPYGVNKKKACW